MSNKKKKKIDIHDLEDSGWIVEVGKKGEKKKGGKIIQKTLKEE